MSELISKLLFHFYNKFKKYNHFDTNVNDEVKCHRVIILHEGNSSTLAYFQSAFCEKFPFAECILRDVRNGEPFIIKSGDAIVIVRFIPRKWQIFIEREIDKISKIIYFFDDDLLDEYALDSLSKDYRMRIIARSAEQHSWLKKHCSNFWVSTGYLQSKYAYLHPEIIPPKPSSVLLEPQRMIKVVYHGTSSHREEKLWLYGIMEQVLQRCPNVSFEIFGEHEIYKLYRELPRVSVLHPMSWENYLAYTKSQEADIGLAPLLMSKFNAARGGVKFYDFVRMGAAGIYSNVSSYSDIITHNETGILLENEPSLWVNEIINLVQSLQKREYIVKNAHDHAKLLSSPLA